MTVAFLLGRVLFSALFIMSGIGHFARLEAMSQYAASAKLPAPKLAVAVSGLMILVGGLSILLGVAVPVGTVLLFLFLVPAAFTIHRFWGIQDPMMAANQQAHFMKNMSLAGAALLIHYLSALHPEAWVYSLAPR